MAGSDWTDLATEAMKSAMEVVSRASAKDWSNAAAEARDHARIVRLDCVDFKYEPIGGLGFLSLTNLSPPFPGILYATRDARVGWIRKTLSDPGWERYEVPISVVTEVQIPLGESGMSKISRVSPTSLRFTAGGKRVFVMFTGTIPERFQDSRIDKVLGKIPSFHGQPIGLYYEVAKVLYQQRGYLERSRGSLQFWSRALVGELDLVGYEMSVIKRLRRLGAVLSVPGGFSIGHIANFLGMEPDEHDLPSGAEVAELLTVRQRFAAEEQLEVIFGAGDDDAITPEVINTVLSACDSLVAQFGSSRDPWLQGAVAAAKLQRGIALAAGDDGEAALRQFNLIIDEVGNRPGWLSAQAHFRRAQTLTLMGQTTAAVSELTRLLATTASSDDEDVMSVRRQANDLQQTLSQL